MVQNFGNLAAVPQPNLYALNLPTYANGDVPMFTSATSASPAGTAGAVSNGFSMRNMLINPEMKVAQRGASIAAIQATAYTLDGWQYLNQGTGAGIITASQSTTVPNASFASSLKFDVTTVDSSIAAGDYYAMYQAVEGLRSSRTSFGTANAKSVTLQFWFRADSSALTFPATFTGALQNSAQNRAYVFTFSQTTNATWQLQTVTITGDVTGTWLQTTGIGLRVLITLACGSTYQGTAGAWTGSDIRGTSAQVNGMGDAANDFYMTGAQLEVGAVATPFEFKAQDQYLLEAYRYYWRPVAAGSGRYGVGYAYGTTNAEIIMVLPFPMRTDSITLGTSGIASDYRLRHNAGSTVACSAVPTLNICVGNTLDLLTTVAAGLTLTEGCTLEATNTSGFISASAEL